MTAVDRTGAVRPALARGLSPRPSSLLGALVALALCAAAGAAQANVMVLSFSGPDAAKLQSAVSAALTGSGQDVAPGDTSFEDAAAMIGCDAQSDACADEVLSTLSVDEVVFGATAKNGEVVLQRAARGQPRRQTRFRVENGQSLDAAVSPAVRELYGEPRAASEPATPPPPLDPAPRRAPEPQDAALGRDSWPTARPYRRWAIITWSGAGAAALTGLVLWINAGSLQDDIDRAPDGTQAEIAALKDLESRAERSSNWGNAMMVVGAGLAGVGTYLWIKDRRQRRSSVATIQPTLYPGGAGVLLTIGDNR